MEIKTASTADVKWNSLLYFPLYVSLFVLPLEIIFDWTQGDRYYNEENETV